MTSTHQLEHTSAGWYCRVCQWTWRRAPGGACPGVRRYAPDAIPAALQTRLQLGAAGLQPGGPAQGCYFAGSHKHWQWLYAVTEARPRPPRTAQEQAQQDRAWAQQQILRIVRQARTGED